MNTAEHYVADPVDIAERRAKLIRDHLNSMIESRDVVLEEIEEARNRQEDVVLGYPSWTAYVAKEYGNALAELGRDDRRDVVAILSETGMSTRAIASVVGASQTQVRRDLQVSPNGSPAQVSHDETPAATVHEGRVVGLDGKAYAAERPARRKPRAKPLNRAIFEANYDLQKIVGRLDRLTQDDRLRRMDTMDREKAKNEVARLQKILFDVRQRLAGGAS